jgi:two-component system capsular synthesis sensor histidine kinase RcsC
LTKPVPLSVFVSVLEAAAVRCDRRIVAEPDIEDEFDVPRFPTVPQNYVRTFAQQIDRDLAAHDQLMTRRDLPGLRRWAHGVSGGLSVLGQSMLYDQCEELRAAIRASDGWSEEVETLASVLGSELRELRESFQASLRE